MAAMGASVFEEAAGAPEFYAGALPLARKSVTPVRSSNP
jgi:hypothetical protein